MAFDAFTGTLTVNAGWNASKNVSGLTNPNNNTNNNVKQMAFSLGAAVAGGVNELYTTLLSIAGGGNASIDLTAITDILGATGISLARVKAIVIRLLSTADDATLGTAASSITIDNTVANALSSQAGSGWFGNAAEGAANGSKFTIPNGGFLAFGTPGANGVLVDSTHKVIKIVNNDGSVTA